MMQNMIAFAIMIFKNASLLSMSLIIQLQIGPNNIIGMKKVEKYCFWIVINLNISVFKPEGDQEDPFAVEYWAMEDCTADPCVNGECTYGICERTVSLLCNNIKNTGTYLKLTTSLKMKQHCWMEPISIKIQASNFVYRLHPL